MKIVLYMYAVWSAPFFKRLHGMLHRARARALRAPGSCTWNVVDVRGRRLILISISTRDRTAAPGIDEDGYAGDRRPGRCRCWFSRSTTFIFYIQCVLIFLPVQAGTDWPAALLLVRPCPRLRRGYTAPPPDGVPIGLSLSLSALFSAAALAHAISLSGRDEEGRRA